MCIVIYMRLLGREQWSLNGIEAREVNGNSDRACGNRVGVHRGEWVRDTSRN